MQPADSHQAVQLDDDQRARNYTAINSFDPLVRVIYLCVCLSGSVRLCVLGSRLIAVNNSRKLIVIRLPSNYYKFRVI